MKTSLATHTLAVGCCLALIERDPAGADDQVADVAATAADRDRVKHPPPVVEPRQLPGHGDPALRPDSVGALLGVYAGETRQQGHHRPLAPGLRRPYQQPLARSVRRQVVARARRADRCSHLHHRRGGDDGLCRFQGLGRGQQTPRPQELLELSPPILLEHGGCARLRVPIAQGDAFVGVDVEPVVAVALPAVHGEI